MGTRIMRHLRERVAEQAATIEAMSHEDGVGPHIDVPDAVPATPVQELAVIADDLEVMAERVHELADSVTELQADAQTFG